MVGAEKNHYFLFENLPFILLPSLADRIPLALKRCSAPSSPLGSQALAPRLSPLAPHTWKLICASDFLKYNQAESCTLLLLEVAWRSWYQWSQAAFVRDDYIAASSEVNIIWWCISCRPHSQLALHIYHRIRRAHVPAKGTSYPWSNGMKAQIQQSLCEQKWLSL